MTSDRWINYVTHGGYNEHDGLGEGHWAPVPGTAGLQKWVGELEAKVDNRRRGTCVDCGGVIDVRSERCRSCRGRQFNRKRWADAS